MNESEAGLMLAIMVGTFQVVVPLALCVDAYRNLRELRESNAELEELKTYESTPIPGP